ncbi:MAG: uracil phosphoribosyltransferase [Pseudomonadota bacterium]|nr:uracil phosphoribosyltransferase [Pseudomonadota bacterium]
MRTVPEFPNLFIVDHPLIQHKLSLMRDKNTPTSDFRRLLREISMLMGYEITRDFPLTTQRIETPLAPMDAPVIAGKKVAIVPILRAGLGMSDGLLELMPSARVGHIGLYRDARDPRIHKPIEYLVKLPSAEGRLFLVADPILATGHSAVHVCNVLKKHGVPEGQIRYLSVVTAPEGVREFHSACPSVVLYTAALDSHLNDHAYIVPGLGDAGDRLFGTK